MSLRSLLRRIARTLRPSSGDAPEPARIKLLMRAVARNARRTVAAEQPQPEVGDDLDSILLSGDARLERDLLDGVTAGEFDSETSTRIVKDIIEGSIDDENRKRALSLVKPD